MVEVTIKRIVKEFGNSGHISMKRHLVGKEVKITYYDDKFKIGTKNGREPKTKEPTISSNSLGCGIKTKAGMYCGIPNANGVEHLCFLCENHSKKSGEKKKNE